MGQFVLFLEQIAPSSRHVSALIHTRVVGSRVDVVTLHYQLVRVASILSIFHSDGKE